jgi:hypothetical protein
MRRNPNVLRVNRFRLPLSLIVVFGVILESSTLTAFDEKAADAVQAEQPKADSEEKANEQVSEGLFVEFSLSRPEGGRYRRPYVAVWLEDQDGFPVKTAALWLQTEQPGPRWHRDLTRWYRNDRMRKLAENADLIDSVSGPTRGPGDYSAYFDGTDNSGKSLPEGKYTLCIEAAREHGTYQLIKENLELSDKVIGKKQLKGNVEVRSACYWFTPSAPIAPGTDTASREAASGETSPSEKSSTQESTRDKQ